MFLMQKAKVGGGGSSTFHPFSGHLLCKAPYRVIHPLHNASKEYYDLLHCLFYKESYIRKRYEGGVSKMVAVAPHSGWMTPKKCIAVTLKLITLFSNS